MAEPMTVAEVLNKHPYSMHAGRSWVRTDRKGVNALIAAGLVVPKRYNYGHPVLPVEASRYWSDAEQCYVVAVPDGAFLDAKRIAQEA